MKNKRDSGKIAESMTRKSSALATFAPTKIKV